MGSPAASLLPHCLFAASGSARLNRFGGSRLPSRAPSQIPPRSQGESDLPPELGQPEKPLPVGRTKPESLRQWQSKEKAALPDGTFKVSGLR
jgi:hypothetical protein